jgi:rhamnose utilization protein RhaD (predicted bifunctional aldolase and dehydrogenase)
MNPPAETLAALSRYLGAESRQMAILGEGNTSAKLGPGNFLVKASGSHLGTLTPEDLVECRSAPLVELLSQSSVSDDEVDRALLECRVNPAAKRPSVEALFHAYLLSLPGIQFVGHTHPAAVTAILCSPAAGDFAARRIFPDQVVCCGPESVLVPYADPGAWLAQKIRASTESYMEAHQSAPRVILLLNHGVITLGPTPESVKAAMEMTIKAATVFMGARALNGPHFLTQDSVERIAGRRDEHYRQAALNISPGAT